MPREERRRRRVGELRGSAFVEVAPSSRAKAGRARSETWRVRLVKGFAVEDLGERRYSPPKVVGVDRDKVWGSPDPSRISTSHVERQHLTMRMGMRRLTRLTNGFSKKGENLRAAVALHFAYCNFVRVHRTIKTTPALAAGVADRRWTMAELVELPY